METKRCFIALNLSKECIEEIKKIQKLISKRFLFSGRYTESDNLHLTLKFLGEIDDKKIERVKERLKKIKFKKFEAVLGDVGLFNYKKNPKIIWAKLNGKGVFDLQKKIDESLKGLFEPEFRFMSHITIARIRHVNNKEGLKKYIEDLKNKVIRFEVKEFSLIKSKLFPEGPEYDILEEYGLMD